MSVCLSTMKSKISAQTKGRLRFTSQVTKSVSLTLNIICTLRLIMEWATSVQLSSAGNKLVVLEGSQP